MLRLFLAASTAGDGAVRGPGKAGAATSGQLWQPLSRVYQAPAAAAAAPALPEAPRRCSKAAVVTTINPPTDAIRSVAGGPGWCLIVVGDAKTPDDEYEAFASGSERVTYLSLAAQRKLPFESIPLTPERHFGRKNIGYLYAAWCGANVIFDFDDDNAPLSVAALDGPAHVAPAGTALLHGEGQRTRPAPEACNPYPVFGAPNSWPRGLPLERINTGVCATANTTDSDHRLGVVQGLANHDPDVDAFYRLGPRTALPLPFSFASEPPLLVLAPGVVAPFNAQATWWYGPAFGGLMLPATVHGRVSDIWRGYIAQNAMRCDHLRLAFAKPVVEQVRNAHDYLKDYMAERPLYEASGALVEALAAVPCAGSLEATIGKAYVVLYEKGFVEREDVARADAFLRDLGRARAAVAPAPARVRQWLPRPDSAGRPARIYADAAAVALARAGKTGTGGRKEVAIMVMTMDDVPFLSRWLIYHGHVFGFENLYVFDGSEGPQKEYLERVQEQLPINVRHSLVNLNQITAELSAWMDEIKGGYEWMMKVDTDEFVAFAQPNGWPNMSSPNLHLPPGASAELLAIDWRAMVAPVQSGSPLESDRAKLDKGVGLLAVLKAGLLKGPPPSSPCPPPPSPLPSPSLSPSLSSSSSSSSSSCISAL